MPSPPMKRKNISEMPVPGERAADARCDVEKGDALRLTRAETVAGKPAKQGADKGAPERARHREPQRPRQADRRA